MGSLDFHNRLILLDGAMGTVLQQRGLPAGGRPGLPPLPRREALGTGQPQRLRAVRNAAEPAVRRDSVNRSISYEEGKT